MLTWSVSKQEEGRRLDRFLMKLFPKAPLSLIYKALRTKTVKLNGKKGGAVQGTNQVTFNLSNT